MLRAIISVVFGIFVAFLVVAIVESAGHLIYPVPASLDLNDPQAMTAYIQSLPAGAFAIVLVAWLLGTLTGGWVAATLSPSRPLRGALIVGSFVLLATIANLAMIPHPLWLVISALLGIPAAALLAARLPRPGARTT